VDAYEQKFNKLSESIKQSGTATEQAATSFTQVTTAAQTTNPQLRQTAGEFEATSVSAASAGSGMSSAGTSVQNAGTSAQTAAPAFDAAATGLNNAASAAQRAASGGGMNFGAIGGNLLMGGIGLGFAFLGRALQRRHSGGPVGPQDTVSRMLGAGPGEVAIMARDDEFVGTRSRQSSGGSPSIVFNNDFRGVSSPDRAVIQEMLDAQRTQLMQAIKSGDATVARETLRAVDKNSVKMVSKRQQLSA
jgi:hypothetical protein